MRVSASSWLHCPIGVPSAICFTQSSFVMYSSFWSGNCPVDSILDRYVKSSFFVVSILQKSLPIPKNFCRTHHTLPTAVCLSKIFFNGHRIVTVPDDIVIFLPNLFHVLFLEKHFFKTFAEGFPFVAFRVRV